MPNACGSSSTSGMNTMPCRSSASTDARHTLPIVCSSMFDSTITDASGKVTHCRRSAVLPISTTAGSLRNSATISGANRNAISAIAASASTDVRTQNQ